MNTVLHFLLLGKKMMKIPKHQHTLIFELLDEKRILPMQSYEFAGNELGMLYQTLRYWVKASHDGRLTSADLKP